MGRAWLCEFFSALRLRVLLEEMQGGLRSRVPLLRRLTQPDDRLIFIALYAISAFIDQAQDALGLGVPLLRRLVEPKNSLLWVMGQSLACVECRAQAELRCQNDLAVVPGATHLFEEPGTLGTAAELARDWFKSHLARGYSGVRM